MPITRRTLLAALAWLAAVAGATAIGLTAVGAIGAGIVGAAPAPLTAGEVQALLATMAPTAPAPSTRTLGPSPSPSPSPIPPAAETVLGSAGGTVLARCVNGAVQVVSATPAQGYQLHDEGGEDAGRVRFESGNRRVELQLSCRDGRPVASVRAQD